MGDRITTFIKAILFPVFCVVCQREGEWWCAECLKKQILPLVFACPVCAISNDSGKPCLFCQAVSFLDTVTALFFYEESAPVAKLIKQFKYNSATDIQEAWKHIFGRVSLQVTSEMVVVPIPLYSRRERERGFNQAQVIGKIMAEELGLPLLTDSLVRWRATAQQAKLSKEERQQNVRDAFRWQSINPPPQNIVLVDDVYTTGATMQECARVLKEQGARKVIGVVLARD